MLPLACIYHATIDRGVAATNLLKTVSTAQKKASEDTMVYKKDNFKRTKASSVTLTPTVAIDLQRSETRR